MPSHWAEASLNTSDAPPRSGDGLGSPSAVRRQIPNPPGGRQRWLVGWHGLVCMVWFGLVWFGLVWFGLVWFGWLVGCKSSNLSGFGRCWKVGVAKDVDDDLYCEFWFDWMLISRWLAEVLQKLCCSTRLSGSAKYCAKSFVLIPLQYQWYVWMTSVPAGTIIKTNLSIMKTIETKTLCVYDSRHCKSVTSESTIYIIGFLIKGVVIPLIFPKVNPQSSQTESLGIPQEHHPLSLPFLTPRDP